MLTRQLQRRFQSIPTAYLTMIEAAHSESLLAWAEKAFTAQTLEEIFNED